MRVIWNSEEQKFQAEFAQEHWRGDMEAAKAAGFRTSGPPAWLWTTSKASVLNKLRKNRPASGLTLTEVALEKFKFRDKQDTQKAELKKAFKVASKASKKVSLDPRISGLTQMKVPAKGYITAEDLPPYTPIYKGFVPPAPPDELCLICDEPIYFYEHLVCLFCEKESDVLLRTMQDKGNMATSDDVSVSPYVARALREMQEASRVLQRPGVISAPELNRGGSSSQQGDPK